MFNYFPHRSSPEMGPKIDFHFYKGLFHFLKLNTYDINDNTDIIF
uniref:Uncharacterized protein n=1 Tax=Anguilla anguilla TaxID=7936 RepID=A0A0E9Q633_ANGAN